MSQPSLPVPTTELCLKCTGIFADCEWSFLDTGWPRVRPDRGRQFAIPYEEPEPAFGESDTHGMKPFVINRGPPPTSSYPHHEIKELRQSAKGCTLCRLVIRKFDVPEMLESYTAEYFMHGRKWNGKGLWSPAEVETARGYVFVYTRKGRDSTLIFRYFVHEAWEEGHNKLVNPALSQREGMKDIKLTISGKYMNDEKNLPLVRWQSQGSTLERVSKWLEDDVTYLQLLPNHLPRELPTRLLQLGTTTSVQDPMVRLVDTCSTSIDVATPYIALSHSWGGSLPLRLEERLLPAFSAGINYSDLPRTFREAVDLTLQLGLRHLWIDSLCIIQDSKADWLQEAQRMALVYTFSHLTIAASASINCNTGLAPTQHPQPIFVRPSWYNYIKTWPYKPGQILRIQDNSSEIFRHAIASAPLNKRGWTFQEYILSPRVLHCATDEWWWRNVSAASPFSIAWRETSTEPEMFFTGPASEYWPDSQWFYSSRDDEDEDGDIRKASMEWNYLIAQYSQRLLTKRRDKLVAIGAVAQIYGRLNKLPVEAPNEFLAGCWRSYMPYGLLWVVDLDAQSHTASTPEEAEEDTMYQIPSWSWASIDGKVLFCPHDAPERSTEITFIDGTVATEGGPYGPVTSAYIILSGPLYHIRAFKRPHDLEDLGWSRDFSLLSKGRPVEQGKRTNNQTSGDAKNRFEENLFSLDSWKGRLDNWASDRDMHLAIVHSRFALLLERVETKGKGWYRRIGATPLSRYKEILGTVRSWGPAVENLPEGDYISKDSQSGKYTYGII